MGGAHLEGARRQLRRGLGLELPAGCRRLEGRVPDPGSPGDQVAGRLEAAMRRPLFVCVAVAGLLTADRAYPQQPLDDRDNASPWGMGTGAEWSRDYPRFHPLIGKAGARWVRAFP